LVVIDSVWQLGDEVFGLYGADGEVVGQLEVHAAPYCRGEGVRRSCTAGVSRG
jgi:hypothetical protein